MSVAVCQSSFASLFMPPPPTSFPADLLGSWQASPEQRCEEESGAIQEHKAKLPAAAQPPPYVHPLLRRSWSLVSLETCTERLGSETGCEVFSGDGADFPILSGEEEEEDGGGEEGREGVRRRRKEAPLPLVNYHCAVGRRAAQPRSFPPPLPSIARRDGPCVLMRPHRRDGRLVVEAVPVPSLNYLHAERHGGRLLLSFAATAHTDAPTELPRPLEAHENETEEKEEEEEEEMVDEVEVVDRGTVIEVKVCTQPQHQGGGAAKVLRSSLVINKFVGAAPLSKQDEWAENVAEDEQQQQNELQSLLDHDNHSAAAAAETWWPGSAISTTAAAAAALGATEIDSGQPPPPPTAVLFTSRRRNRAEVLRSMRRCSQLHRQLFTWEPNCVVTSS